MKFRKSFILSTKKWIKCLPGENPVNLRGESGDITPCLNDMEIRLGVPRFPVFTKLELHHCGSKHGTYIEVEKIDPAVLSPVEHSLIGSASSRLHAPPFQRYYGFNCWVVR